MKTKNLKFVRGILIALLFAVPFGKLLACFLPTGLGMLGAIALFAYLSQKSNLFALKS